MIVTKLVQKQAGSNNIRTIAAIMSILVILVLF